MNWIFGLVILKTVNYRCRLAFGQRMVYRSIYLYYYFYSLCRTWRWAWWKLKVVTSLL